MSLFLALHVPWYGELVEPFLRKTLSRLTIPLFCALRFAAPRVSAIQTVARNAHQPTRSAAQRFKSTPVVSHAAIIAPPTQRPSIPVYLRDQVFQITTERLRVGMVNAQYSFRNRQRPLG